MLLALFCVQVSNACRVRCSVCINRQQPCTEISNRASDHLGMHDSLFSVVLVHLQGDFTDARPLGEGGCAQVALALHHDPFSGGTLPVALKYVLVCFAFDISLMLPLPSKALLSR